MPTLSTYLNNLYSDTGLAVSYERRQNLIREMQELEGKTIHCYTCPGTCCTQAANSMLITPIEALEILQGLKIESFTESEMAEFKSRLSKTIQDFRLNVEIYTGKKNSSEFRKTYTCPFFNNGSLGCGLSRGIKPYGCLGFNPKASDDNGKSCSSNLTLLEEREAAFLETEDAANSIIRSDLNIYWIKKNIPDALLDMIEKLHGR